MWAAFYGPPERELLGLNGSRDEASFLVRLRGHEALASCRVSLAASGAERRPSVAALYRLCRQAGDRRASSPASQGPHLLEVKVVRVPLVIPLALLAI